MKFKAKKNKIIISKNLKTKIKINIKLVSINPFLQVCFQTIIQNFQIMIQSFQTIKKSFQTLIQIIQ